ncbi:MAG: uL22 family ribosomal protein [Patescibacteria group bacterium]
MAKAIEKQTNHLIIKGRFIRFAPDKIRILSKVLIGKSIEEGLNILNNTSRSAAKPLILILKNGINQAQDRNLGKDIKISAIRINEGPKLKRRRLIHRGRAVPILKRMSHILINLQVMEKNNPKSVKEERPEKSKGKK